MDGNLRIKKTFMTYAKRLHRGNFKERGSHNTMIQIRAAEDGLLTKAHVESFRRMFTREAPSDWRLWFKHYGFTPITEKRGGHRMGKGAGEFRYYAAAISRGTVVFEISNPWGLTEDVFTLAGKAAKKLSFRVIISYNKKNLSSKKNK